MTDGTENVLTGKLKNIAQESGPAVLTIPTCNSRLYGFFQCVALPCLQALFSGISPSTHFLSFGCIVTQPFPLASQVISKASHCSAFSQRSHPFPQCKSQSQHQCKNREPFHTHSWPLPRLLYLPVHTWASAVNGCVCLSMNVPIQEDQHAASWWSSC